MGKYDSGKRFKKIKGDFNFKDAVLLMEKCFLNLLIKSSIAIFVFLDDRMFRYIFDVTEKIGWKKWCACVWVKSVQMLSLRQQYHQKHELFIYFTNGPDVLFFGGGTYVNPHQSITQPGRILRPH